MALVIGHMGIVATMLILTYYVLSMKHSADTIGGDFRKAKRGQVSIICATAELSARLRTPMLHFCTFSAAL